MCLGESQALLNLFTVIMHVIRIFSGYSYMKWPYNYKHNQIVWKQQTISINKVYDFYNCLEYLLYIFVNCHLQVTISSLI